MSGLTKRHFEELAEIVSRARTALDSQHALFGSVSNGEQMLQGLENLIVDFCARHNPGFDEARFRKAARHQAKEEQR